MIRTAVATQLNDESMLILRVGTSRLAVHADAIKNVLNESRPWSSDEIANRLDGVAGLEALALLSLMSNNKRQAAIAQAELAPEKRSVIQDLSQLLGDPRDPHSAASAIAEMYPDILSDAGSLQQHLEKVSIEDDAEVRRRYIQTYASLSAALDRVLIGSQGKAAMAVLGREEPNFRRAVQWAVADGNFSVAAAMGDTFKDYLERANRPRERDAWVQWLADEAGKIEWSNEAAAAERNAAWSLLTQGRSAETLERLRALIHRLEKTTEFDPAFQLAFAYQWLGRVYDTVGQPATAIPILRDAFTRWQTLIIGKAGKVDPSLNHSGERVLDAQARMDGTVPDDTDGRAAGHAVKRILADPTLRDACATEVGNLSATLGDLANALMAEGQTDAALQTAEQAIAINQGLGNKREAATGLGQTAQILMQQGRYAEADQRYEQALAAARAVGDTELEATTLQHHGKLAKDSRQYDQAVERYKRALKLSQQAGDNASVMRTCNLLGVVEKQQGRLAEARAWYERSREIAAQLQDHPTVAGTAQNLGIVCQLEGEAARTQGDSSADQHFTAAERYFLESLDVWQKSDNEPNEAMSAGQLGKLYLLMNRLDEAEQHAQRAREIGERLGDLRLLSSVYQFLKNIAQARGDTTSANQWAEQERAVNEELARRARGDDDDAGVPAELERMLAGLTVACVQTALGGTLPREAAEVLQQMNDPAAGPLQALSVWLQNIAAAREADLAALLAAPPPDLPAAVQQVLEEIRQQL